MNMQINSVFNLGSFLYDNPINFSSSPKFTGNMNGSTSSLSYTFSFNGLKIDFPPYEKRLNEVTM